MAAVLVAFGLFVSGCNDGISFGPPPTLDSADWSLVDRDADAFTYIRLINPTTQTVERITFDGIDARYNTMDLSVSNSGMLAVRSGTGLTIVRLSDKSVLMTSNAIGEYIAWSNSGDQLAMVAGFGSTLLILDSQLNTLMSRTLPFIGSEYYDSDISISWSPDDSSIVVSTTKESSIPPLGTAVYEGIGLVINSADLDSGDTEIPYATVYYLGDNLLVGTRYSAASGLTRSQGSVHIFSLSSSGVEAEGDAIPGAVAVASSWSETGTFLTYETPPFFVGEFGVFHSWHRIRNTEGKQSELLGDGPVRYGGSPIKLIPHNLVASP